MTTRTLLLAAAAALSLGAGSAYAQTYAPGQYGGATTTSAVVDQNGTTTTYRTQQTGQSAGDSTHVMTGWPKWMQWSDAGGDSAGD